jgi:hypothetical protein
MERVKHFQKYGVTWRGTITHPVWSEGDETIAPHVLLYIANRKGLHYVVLEQEKVNLSSLESLAIGPFRPEQKVTVLEYYGEIIQVSDGYEDGSQVLFQSYPGERPWGYRLKHDILDPLCACNMCTCWEHWYVIPPGARKAFLSKGNKITCFDDLGHQAWHPAFISAGFPYWEFIAHSTV